jgi:hypothetical protein
LAQRSRKRRAGARPITTHGESNGAGPRRLRGEERDAAIRAELEPLAPGERPLAITIAAIAAAVIAIANLAVWIAGWKLGGKTPSTFGALAFPAIMLIAAVAMWQRVYWAVLGFQALLAITILIAGLSLLLAGNVEGALVSLAILVPSCVLFWFLIRAMARLRMPERPSPEAGR